jgi:ABC-type branched-subunit amino acid transport system permease subunit
VLGLAFVAFAALVTLAEMQKPNGDGDIPFWLKPFVYPVVFLLTLLFSPRKVVRSLRRKAGR